MSAADEAVKEPGNTAEAQEIVLDEDDLALALEKSTNALRIPANRFNNARLAFVAAINEEIMYLSRLRASFDRYDIAESAD